MNKISKISKMFWFHVDMNDYRSGTNIYTFEKGPIEDDKEDEVENNEDENKEDEEDVENDRAPEEAVPYSVPLPTQSNYRIYILNEFPEYKIIDYIDADEEKDCQKLYMKMYSQLHECLPFSVTGYNSAYKEEGYYPEVPENIKNMPKIEKIKNNEDDNFVYFVFAIDRNGKEVFTNILMV